MLLNLSQEATADKDDAPVQRWLGLVVALALGGVLAGATLRAPMPKGGAPAITPLADEIPTDRAAPLLGLPPRVRGCCPSSSSWPPSARCSSPRGGSNDRRAARRRPDGRAARRVSRRRRRCSSRSASRARSSKRNALSIFLSIELMMNAVNLLFLTYARMRGDIAGQMIVFFVIASRPPRPRSGLRSSSRSSASAARWTWTRSRS